MKQCKINWKFVFVMSTFVTLCGTTLELNLVFNILNTQWKSSVVQWLSNSLKVFASCQIYAVATNFRLRIKAFTILTLSAVYHCYMSHGRGLVILCHYNESVENV